MTKTKKLVVAILGLTLSLNGMAADTNTLSVRPEVIMPLLKLAPQIDGVIEEGEWNTLHVSRFVAQRAGGKDLLQPRLGEFWIGCDTTNLYIAVRSAVHPTAGPMAEHEPEGAKDIGQTIYDDSIELWIDNDPEGKGGKYYQIMVNSLGATFDKMHDRADGSANLWWRPDDFRQAHTVENGVWIAEFAIPLADLEIEDLSQPIAMRVCRNYKYPWDQSRWAPNVNAFDSAESMARVKFVESAPVVSEVGFQDDDGIRVAVDVANPTGAALPVHVKLGYNAEQQPRYYEEWEAVLEPGASRRFEYEKEFFSPENYPALAEIRVTGADGVMYYQRDVKWHTQPEDPWDKVAVKDKEQAFEFAIEWHPTPKLLRWRSDFSGFQDRQDVQALRVEVRDQGDDQVVARMRVEEFAKFATEQRLDLPELADGLYRAELYVDSGAADEDDDKPVKSLPFEQRSDFAWLDNDIGVSDEVIPPFTPLEVEGDRVSAILREHTLSDIGLWSSVVADGEEILAGPMRFEVVQNGKPQTTAGTVAVEQAEPHVVTTRAEWTAGDIQGVTRGELEYDGCMKVTLELSQNGDAPVDALDLVIPLKNDFMPLMHACGDGLRINYGGAVPVGEGEVWSSIKASRSDLIGTFLPYLWIGEEGRGLTWFAANDQDWVVDTTDKTPALALERNGDELSLRVRLIQKPTVLERTHTITFGLMATPTKPMPENWRRLGLFHGGKENVTFLGMCMYWGGQLYGVFPMERDFTVVKKIAESGKHGEDNREFFEQYKEEHPEVKNEINWSANLRNADAIVPYTNIRGAVTYTPEWRVYQDEWRRVNFGWRQTATDRTSGRIDFTVIPVPSRVDFLLYYYKEFLENGMDGIYWDNICIYSNSNRVTSDGYVREDGLFQPEADIWRLREVTKRTAVLGHQLGKPNYNMPHMTNASLAPVFSWTGFYLGWEWKYGTSDWQTRFTREYIRTINIGRQTGNIPGALEGHTHMAGEHRGWVERTRAGVVLTHEIIMQRPDKFLNRVLQSLYDMGYGTDACRVYNYWQREPVARVEGIDSSWIVHDSEDQTLIVLCDWSDGGKPVVTLDCKRLGLPEDFQAKNWEDETQVFHAVDGRLTLPELKKHDLMILRIGGEK